MKSLIDQLDLPKDFLFQIISLFISILLIHTIYLLFIDPAAANEIAIAIDQNKAPNRTFAVILKDFEQEACIILFFLALSIIFIKWKEVSNQANFIRIDFLLARTNLLKLATFFLTFPLSSIRSFNSLTKSLLKSFFF